MAEREDPFGDGEAPGGDAWGPEGSLEEACREKDLLISSLEREVAQQRQLRAQDARQVEAKAMRIKDWVAHKLGELELQNAHLQVCPLLRPRYAAWNHGA